MNQTPVYSKYKGQFQGGSV